MFGVNHMEWHIYDHFEIKNTVSKKKEIRNAGYCYKRDSYNLLLVRKLSFLFYVNLQLHIRQYNLLYSIYDLNINFIQNDPHRNTKNNA